MAEAGIGEDKLPDEHPWRPMQKAATYLTNHQDKMNYPEYRRQGLPTTSSLIESQIKEFNARVPTLSRIRVVGLRGHRLQARDLVFLHAAGPAALRTKCLGAHIRGLFLERLFREVTGHGPTDPHGQLFDLGEGPGGAKSRRHRWSGGKPGFDSAIDFSMCRRLECHQGILRKMGKVI